MKKNDFVGTGTLLRLFIRRDRFLSLVWILAPFMLAVATASTFGAMDLEVAIQDFISDPVISAMQGPVMTSTLAGVIVWRMMGLNVILLGIGSVITIVRHTRTEEESGRSELIRAYVTGKYANLTAALFLTLIINGIAGLLQTILLISVGGNFIGSILFGLTVVAGGFFYAGIGALGTQLRENAGGARGLGLLFVGIGFFLMIINNGSGGYTPLKWITPMTWHRLTQPLGENSIGFLFYFLTFSVIPILLSFILSNKRDVGAGIMPSKQGIAKAKPSFNSPLALSWRLHKSSFWTWFIGVGAFGAGIGSIAQNISDNEELGSLLGSLGDTNWVLQVGNQNAFVGIIVYIVSLAVALYGISTVLKSHKEEIESRGELILSKPVSRQQWIRSHLLIAFVTSASLMLMMGLGSGLINGMTAENFADTFLQTFIMSVSKIPAVWMLVGITSLINGFIPKGVSALSWTAWIIFAGLELLWEGGLIGWTMMRLSPFSFAHYIIPVNDLPWFSLMLLSLLSITLTLFGLYGFSKRDILTKA